MPTLLIESSSPVFSFEIIIFSLTEIPLHQSGQSSRVYDWPNDGLLRCDSSNFYENKAIYMYFGMKTFLCSIYISFDSVRQIQINIKNDRNQ